MTPRPRRSGLARWLFVVLVACKSSSAPASAPHIDAGTPCTVLFGRPNASTGLTSAQCQPSCACSSLEFTPPTYDAAFTQALLDDWTLAAPYPQLTSSPYTGPTPAPEASGTVCAVLPSADAGSPRAYTLATFASSDAAAAAGGAVTHFGACGVCSPLTDLVVYMKNDDLTAPVRACGIDAAGDLDADVACLMKLGFDRPCAEAWAYDTQNTSAKCLSVCASTLSDPYNTPDGGLSPCLACDENESGPVFKAVAGRTRRNSGLPNAICRPCAEVQPLVHAY